MDQLIESGRARPALRRLADLHAPASSQGRSISEVLQEMRDAEER